MRTGVYEIVNRTNGHRYVGSTVDFFIRWNEHRRHLASGIHHSIPLQRAYDKHGKAALAFRPLIVCDRENLRFFEQRCIDRLAPTYNVCKEAGTTRGRKHSPEHRAAMSRRLLGNTYSRGIKHSPEACQRMGAGKVGKKRAPFTDSHRALISAAKRGHNGGVGRPVSLETREKIARTLKGRGQVPERAARRAKLSPFQVQEIRRRSGAETQRSLAKAFGVSPGTIWRLLAGKRYAWVGLKSSQSGVCP